MLKFKMLALGSLSIKRNTKISLSQCFASIHSKILAPLPQIRLKV